MKTFEDYVSESRQKYIFGGTDDRNVNLEDEPKKLSELKKYDIVYYFNTWTMKRPDIGTINDISSGKTNTCISLSLKSNSNIRIAAVHNKSLDEDCFFRYLQDPGGDFEVISTNKDSFLSELYGHHYRTIDTSLIDEVDESRQNYIFGGTDDRNTHVTSGTFEDLRVGDSIYCFFSRQMKKPVLATIIGIKEESDCILFDLNCIDDRVIIDKFYKDSTIYYYTRHNIVGGYVLVCTDKEDFLGHLRELRRNFTSRDIEDKTMNESSQNYIFGGTDNRNTNIDVKSFEELKKGDFLYMFDSENTKPYTTKVFSTYFDNDMLKINYRLGPYVFLVDFTQDGAKESFSIRYADDKDFVAYSTDKNLMIDELKKLKYFFREDDFIYR